MRALFLLLVSLVVLPGVVIAQDYKTVPVFLTASPGESDSVGKQLVFELREAIRGASALRLIDETYRGPRLVVWLNTMYGLPAHRGLYSSFAVILTFDNKEMPLYGALVTHALGGCGADKVASCARQILSTIDEGTELIRRQEPRLWMTLQ